MRVFQFLFRYFVNLVLLLWMSLGVSSCNSPTTCNYEYKAIDAPYCANGALNSHGIEDARFIFYDLKDKSFVAAGFFKEGFRNGKWEYDNKQDIQTIEWGYYKDKNLDVETNVFSKIDSVKYGPFFSKLKFQGEHGDIILAISINGPFKDSIPEKNYAKNTTDEFSRMGVVTTNVRSSMLKDNRRTIYLNDFSLQDSSGKELSVKNLFCRINSSLFVEMSVKCEIDDRFTAATLFEGVLTNSYFNKLRLYNPFMN